jgi:hypothetical protein
MINLNSPSVRDDPTLVPWSLGNVFAFIEKNTRPDMEPGWHSQLSFYVVDPKRNLTVTARLHLPKDQATTPPSLTLRFTQTDPQKDDEVDPIDFLPKEKFVSETINSDEVRWRDVARPRLLLSEDQLANHIITRLVSGRSG